MPTKSYPSITNQCTIKFILILCFISLFISNSCNAYDNINLSDLGNKYFIEHKYDKALKIYEEAIKKGYKSFDVLYNLGFIYYYEKRELKKAEELFNKGVLIYPNSDILHSVLSQLYFELGDFYKAIKEYKITVKLARDRVIKINANKAKELLGKQGKSEKEIYDFFLEIIKFNPKDTMAIYETAEYDQKEKRFDEALDKYRKIIKVDPSMKEHLALEIGVCYYNLKDYKTALEYFEKARESGDLVPEVFIDKAKENIFKNNKTVN